MKLEQTERTFCDCRRCKAFCRTIPGDLAPGDIERIARYLGVEPSDEFIEQNFLAAEGRTVNRDGTEKKVPTIVPAQREDGTCVFFTSDERCAIHQVAPYGCSKFNYCDEPDDDDRHRMKMLLDAISKAPEEYITRWATLRMNHRVARPLLDQLTAFHDKAGPPIKREN